MLSWLSLGCPEAALISLRLGASLTSRQWSAVRNLEHLGVDGSIFEFDDAVDMG